MLKLPEYVVKVNDLQEGVYIKLKEKWFQHPFMFQHFKITTQSQIEALKDIGILDVVCIPSKCDKLPVVNKVYHCDIQQYDAKPLSSASPELDSMWKEKNERISLLRDKKIRIAQTQVRYKNVLAKMSMLVKNVAAGSNDALSETVSVVDEIASVFLKDTDSIVCLMDGQSTDDGLSNHSLNVAVLALMTGKSANLSADEMRHLGLGAMLHDIGKVQIEKKILRKQTPLTKPESDLLKLHVQYGMDVVGKLKALPVQVSRIIQQHHELANGGGYPLGIKGSAISRLSMITVIANIYDSLCNPTNPAKALLPYHALSVMFTKYKCLIDSQLFTHFVRSVGIYPPGSVVQLTNDAIGMVISINSRNPLKPSILLYDPMVPKDEALIFGLDEEPALAITQCISPQNLPKEIYSYLDPKPRNSYFPEEQK